MGEEPRYRRYNPTTISPFVIAADYRKTPCASIRAISLLPPHRQHLPSSHCDSLTPSALPASPLARFQIPLELIFARAPLEAGPAAGDDDDASMA